MNASPFWPLVWKEYRTGRAFWLAMAAMGLLAQAGVAWAHQPADRTWWLYEIALMISAGFAVGIGGTRFAVEHEDRTFGLLRVLPVQAKELGSAKLLCAVIGLCSLLMALWLTAGALAGWQALSPRDAGRLWGLWGLACAEGLAWGILCSLIIRSPLRATVAAVLAVTLAIQAAVTLTKTHNLLEIASYVEAIPLRLFLLALVVAADVWLLPRWLAGQFPQSIDWRRTRRPSVQTKSAGGWQSPAPSWAAPLGRLMWQAWCEAVGSAWWLIGLGLASVLVCAAVSAVLLYEILDFGQVYVQPPVVGGSRLIPLFALMPFILMTALFGSLAFSVDPMWRARFLAEHGVSPRLVWLSRQIVWGGWLFGLLAIAVVLTVVPWLIPPPVLSEARPEGEWWDTSLPGQTLRILTADSSTQRSLFRLCNEELATNAWLVWAMLFSAYCVAQLLSLMVRRRLLAAVFSIVLGCVAAGWTYLMCVLDVPWLWSVLPLGIACLMATWLRAPSWLFARGGWRGWMGPMAVIVAALAGIAVGIPVYRVDEIPTIAVNWAAQDRSPADVADAKTTIDLYQRAYQAYLSERHTSGKEWQDLLVEASRQKSPWMPEAPKASWQISLTIRQLATESLEVWATASQQEGQLAEALNAYLTALRVANHFDQCAPALQVDAQYPSIRCQALAGLRSWAGASGQTAEQIRAAIHSLEESHPAQPAPIARLEPWYAAVSLAIRDLPAALDADAIRGSSIGREEWIASRLPWERERALRLLNLIASIEGERAGVMEWALQKNDSIDWLLAPAFEPNRYADGMHIEVDRSTVSLLQIDQPHRFTQWLRTTPLIEDRDFAFAPQTWLVATEETDYRATLIVLALEAWKIEHGQLPDRLDQLVPAELAALPLDSVCAKQFLYYPHGLAERGDTRIILSGAMDIPEQQPNAPPAIYPPLVSEPPLGERPFLWSALSPNPGGQRVVATELQWATDSEPYVAYYGVRATQLPFSHFETGILPAGRAYFVPRAEEKQP
jgi:hypothetical protein